MFNSKSLFLSLILFLSFFFSKAVYGYDNIEIKVIENKIIASTKIREVESWWPKVSYKIIDKELWETEFPGIGDGEKIIGPTEEINNKIYFAYSSYLMEFDLISAKFTDRFYLPGEVLNLNSEEGKISFSLAISPFELPQKNKIDPTELKKISRNAFLSDHSEKQTKIKIWDAQRFSRKISQNIYITDLINDRYSQDILQIIKENYLEAVRIDLTNPWYYIYLGLISEKLGRSIYANVYFQKALEIKSLVFFDFFQLSSFFEYIGKRKLADRAFESGVQDFIGRGYYPEQLVSIPVIINYFPWLMETIENLKDQDPERVFILIERFNKIAPFKEGNYNILNSFSKYLIEQGKLLEAKEWKLKALEVRGYFFPSDYSIILADVFLNLFIACMISSVIFIFSVIIWHFKCVLEYKRIFPEKRNYFFRRFYKKSQIFPLFLLYLFSLFFLSGFGYGIKSYELVTNIPEDGKKGSWGNEETNKYFMINLNNNFSGDTFRAIANIQAKNFSNAKKILEKINTPEAYNNLGVIYFLENKKELARLAFEKAIESNKYLSEATYNLSLINDPLKTPKRKVICCFT